MKRSLRLKVVLPITLGLFIAGLLFVLGDIDDAPGLGAIGIAIGFILNMIGINNAGLIKKGWFLSQVFLFFAFFIGLLTIVLWMDSELTENPGMAIIGLGISFMLLIFTFIKIKLIYVKR